MLSSNTSAVSGDTVYVEDVFSTYLYTGTGAAQTITNNIDLSTKGGMVWIKSRSAATNGDIFDTSRGVGRLLWTASTAAEANTTDTQKTLTAFNTSGFSLGTDAGAWGANTSADTYTSWTFRKQPKFFDVVTYTGTGTTMTVAHSLGSVPGCMIVKGLNSASAWDVYHRSLGNTQVMRLSTTDATSTQPQWNDTSPTATEFTVKGGETTNVSGRTYVAYLFAHDAGGFGLTGTDNVISCGSSDGSAVNLGWEPQWLLYRSSNFTDDWHIIDNMRGAAVGSPTYNTWSNLNANTSAAETSVTGSAGNPNIKFSATGFTLGAIAGTAIYIAIRRGPMKVPTDATKVFAPLAVTNTTGTVNTTNFPVDLQMLKDGRAGVSGIYAIDRLRGVSTTATEVNNPYLQTPFTNAESSFTVTKAWNNTGFQTSSSFTGASEVYWNFQRAPSFFDEVCATSNGSAVLTSNHNLGVTPELIITKRRSGVSDWPVYCGALSSPTDKYLNLNQTIAATTYVGGYSVSSTSFTVNGLSASSTYVSYLFATCAGVSKVGSYTGTGTTKQVDCGFAAGARFVLIKRTDSTGDWYVWDTARGIVSGNDPYLLLNSTAAETTTTDYIDPYSAGFELSSTAPAALNASGGTYIFLAIA